MELSEEQELEIEALQSLYSRENEFIRLTNNSFRLHLSNYHDPQQEDNSLKQTLALEILFTPDYPATAPQWKILDFNLVNSEERDEIHTKLTTIVSESLGYPMVFTMAEALQNFLSTPEQALHDGVRPLDETSPTHTFTSQDSVESETVVETNETSTGLKMKQLCEKDQRITKEEFLIWKEAFRRKMIETGKWVYKSKGSKLTGKEIFDQQQKLSKSLPLEEDKTCSDEDEARHWKNAHLFVASDPKFSADVDLFSDDDDKDYDEDI